MSIVNIVAELSLYLAQSALFVLGAGFVILLHEIGHFAVARWCSVRVLAICIGFGPKFVNFTNRRGTRWSIACLPVGGYLTFEDAIGPASEQRSDGITNMVDRGQFRRLLIKKAAIFISGPITNLLLAVVLITAAFMIYGEDSGIVRINSIRPLSPSTAAELKVGDVVLSINGSTVRSVLEAQDLVCANPSRSIEIGVERDARQLLLKAEHEACGLGPLLGMAVSSDVLGMGLLVTGRSKAIPIALVTAVNLAIRETSRIVIGSLSSFALIVRGLHNEKIDDLTPSAHPADRFEIGGPSLILSLLGGLSVLVACFNMLPFLPLDGGQLLLCGVEAIRGNPVSYRAKKYSSYIGLAIVLVLSITSGWNFIRQAVP
jgi:regulator of sigma E protease